MTKKELIDRTHKYMCKDGGYSRKAAEQAIKGALEAISEELKNGCKVVITGFGTFDISKHADRVGRNPKTGAEVLIPARNVVKFKPGKKLKERVN
ncbi:MAG: HU family DNA-binding protein [Pseudodesulfovibrio sp.]|nr:HU family DNA-binding protein [Pseudodesulfovibrio sp.]